MLRKAVVVLFLLLFFLPLPSLYAQSPTPRQEVDGAATLGVAHMVEVAKKDVPDGSILSSGSKGAVQTVIPYDSQTLGVVSRDAAIILVPKTTQIRFRLFPPARFMCSFLREMEILRREIFLHPQQFPALQ